MNDSSKVALLLAAGRVGVGARLAPAPERLGGGWVGEVAEYAGEPFLGYAGGSLP